MLAAALLLTGCLSVGGEDPSGPEEESPEPSHPESSRPGDEGLAADLRLVAVPDDDDRVAVHATDFTRVEELLEEPRPEPGEDWEGHFSWFNLASSRVDEGGLLALLPASYGWNNTLAGMEAIAEGVGTSLVDVDRFVEMPTPPGEAKVIHGPYSTEAITEALGADEDGVWTLGEDDGSVDMERLDIAPPTGRGFSLTEVDGRLAFLRSADQAAALAAGEAETVADDADALAVADALDAHPWYSLMMFEAPAADPLHPGDLMLEPFTWIGVSVDATEEEPPEREHTVRIAYQHEDVETAQANAEIAAEMVEEGTLANGTPYAEIFELADLELQDELLTVTLRHTDGEIHRLWTMIAQRESLFTHP